MEGEGPDAAVRAGYAPSLRDGINGASDCVASTTYGVARLSSRGGDDGVH